MKQVKVALFNSRLAGTPDRGSEYLQRQEAFDRSDPGNQNDNGEILSKVQKISLAGILGSR
jgi:hypothetical protein